jgi:hypothetical protein
MSPAEQRYRLRLLCAEKGFIAEPLPGGRTFRLIWTDVGHAVRNGARGSIGFSAAEAIAFLKAFDAESVGG